MGGLLVVDGWLYIMHASFNVRVMCLPLCVTNMVTDEIFCVPERLGRLSLIGVRFMCFNVYTLNCSSCCIKHKLKCSPIRVSFSCWAEKLFISV